MLVQNVVSVSQSIGEHSGEVYFNALKYFIFITFTNRGAKLVKKMKIYPKCYKKISA